MTREVLLQVDDLHIRINGAQVVRGIGFRLSAGARLGIVGESGSGKSLTALACVRLLPATARTVSGKVYYRGQDLLSLSEQEMAAVRGDGVGIVFQNATAALNPVLRIGTQLVDAQRSHGRIRRSDARTRAVELLHGTGMPSPENQIRAYPHELSGGMAQRALIALSLAGRPGVLIADEPTTGLDLTIQAQVLRLLTDRVTATGAGLILISHDIGVVANVCEEVAVMYAGRIVETGPCARVLGNPAHPYTRALVACADETGIRKRGRLPSIGGHPPDLHSPLPGCAFASRCPIARETCQQNDPLLKVVDASHLVACHFPHV